MITRRGMLEGFFGAVVLAVVAGPAQATEKLNIFAAASLKNALDDVTAAWQAETGHQAAISYASTSALAKQIEAGAPADVFISADLEWMNYLAKRNLLTAKGSVKLLGNRLVLIAPAGSKASISISPGFDLAGLLGDGRLALADVKTVPAGKYAKAALETLGVWASVEGRLAQAENVRAALKFVAAGEAPLGIVYQTDARAEASVKVLGVFPDSTHPAIIYPAAVLAESTNPVAANFLSFLQSKRAAEIFTKQGFAMLSTGI